MYCISISFKKKKKKQRIDLKQSSVEIRVHRQKFQFLNLQDNLVACNATRRHIFVQYIREKRRNLNVLD